MAEPGPLLVKLGGSLITDKRVRESVRPEILARLARELVDCREAWSAGGLVVGHGSGSFGHFAAAGSPLAESRRAPTAVDREALRAATARTHDAAARLHRHVVGALLDAGVGPYSLSPSGWLTAAAGEVASVHLEPIEGALRLGLVPVVHGDVVVDLQAGAVIASTELVFEALCRGLGARGRRPRLAIWLGETDGILDRSGARVERVTAASLEAVRAATAGSRGVDVTGGMRLRLETAWRLACAGVPSRIVDGRIEGSLTRVLGGDCGGTRVEAPG
ncbi:MAG TPA: isopentenyl phosphate kinase [Thermoanaerobaculia bacterium]|nr:isopentenyl phosphate kinase [Thermoanaerobaculia bacterium]